MCMDVLKKVFVEGFTGLKAAETECQKEPAPLRAGHGLIPPGLVTQLAVDLIPQLLML